MSAQNPAGPPPQETGGTAAAGDVAVAAGADPASEAHRHGGADAPEPQDFGHSESRGDARPASFARRVLAQPAAKLGLVLTGLVLLLAVLGPFVVPAWTGHGPNSFAGKPFQTGVFGTDNLGRDVLSRFLEGGWRLLLYSALATVVGVAAVAGEQGREAQPSEDGRQPDDLVRCEDDEQDERYPAGEQVQPAAAEGFTPRHDIAAAALRGPA